MKNALHAIVFALLVVNIAMEEDTTTPKNDCQPWTCAATLCRNVTPCPKGTILAAQRGYCGCCMECVVPKIGDDCYKDGKKNNTLTCGPSLKCDKNRKCVC